MKIRHNKKRNTAFVYEALIREATVAILKNDVVKRNKVVSLIKKHFHDKSVLRRELECYRSLYEMQELNVETAKRIIIEARMATRLLDIHGLFVSQSDLIDDVNKEITPEVFNNFVPNYKTLASISQMFSSKTSPKDQIILENEIIKSMTRGAPTSYISSPVDNVTYRTFVQKFNTKYERELLQEQKELLTHYIASFGDNALQLKIYLNNEIARLKTKLAEAHSVPEIKDDAEMLKKTQAVIERLQSFSREGITENVLMTVLRTQSLVEEIYNVNHD